MAPKPKIAVSKLGVIEGASRTEFVEGIWHFDDDDWALIAMLQDPIHMSELLFTDPKNRVYSGCYHVMDYQYPLFRPTDCYQIFPCGRSVGKAQPNDELVLTPFGWTVMGDLTVGDVVVGSDGLPTEVVGVHPQGKREIYEVSFSDGAVVRADAEHLWEVTCDSWRARGLSSQLKTTTGIHESLAGRPDQQGGSRNRWKTPLVGPVEFLRDDVDVGMDPYLLGVLLGDGGFTRPTMVRFSSEDQEIVTAVRGLLDVDEELVHDGGCNYRLRWRRDFADMQGTAGRGKVAPPTMSRLRQMGLMGKRSEEKSIPDDYMWASVEDRLALLQGLVDTDGYVVPHAGCVEYSSSSLVLAQQVRDLAKSLGGRASLREHPTPKLMSYRVVFRLPEQFAPCRLSRKLMQVRWTVRHTMSRAIVGCRCVGVAEATCIEVANSDGLYVTSGFVVTHNTESIKAKAVCHVFRRQGEDMLVGAPELIHLLPLTDAIESRIRATRLTSAFVDDRNQRTGYTHKPFGVNFIDGTKIVGRIPKISGTGFKAMHEPDMVLEEAQDMPEKGYIEAHETVIKDHVDRDGQPDFTYHLYGVQSGAKDGRFYRLSTSGEFKITRVTALMRPGWGPAEKGRAAAMYGGTQSPDYKRNILGEAGGSSSAFFVTARLMSCLDQDRESKYNEVEWKRQELLSEEVDRMLGDYPDKGERDEAMLELLRSLIDLPELGQQVYFGMDIGLVNDPTVITLWSIESEKGKSRLKLVRMFHLWRFREKQIRQVLYLIGFKYGQRLRGGGIDATGLGLPLFQAMGDDEVAPQHLLDVTRGYVFNAKVPIGIDKSLVTKDSSGMMRDHYGNIVEEETDPFTGTTRWVVRMTMIEASTRYLREFVDTGFMLLPFDPEIVGDMQGETEQRVKAMAGARKKPAAFHILDSMRAFAMAYKAADVEQQLKVTEQTPVLARAVDASHLPAALR